MHAVLLGNVLYESYLQNVKNENWYSKSECNNHTYLVMQKDKSFLLDKTNLECYYLHVERNHCTNFAFAPKNWRDSRKNGSWIYVFL